MIIENGLQKFTIAGVSRYAVIGAGIAFALIVAFIDCSMIISRDDLGFGGMVILPISTVTVGGSIGGIVFYVAGPLRRSGNTQKVIVNIFCTAVYIVGLWMSLVAALSVTGHWD